MDNDKHDDTTLLVVVVAAAAAVATVAGGDGGCLVLLSYLWHKRIFVCFNRKWVAELLLDRLS